MAKDAFVGRWKIVACIPQHSQTSEDCKILEGCEFDLCKDGEVRWFPVKRSDTFPLLQCDTFGVVRRRGGSSVSVKLRFGAFLGHVIEFEVEVKNRWDFHRTDIMTLTYPGLFVLQCKLLQANNRHAKKPNLTNTSPYDLLLALEEGFFSDLVIESSSGRKFKVHQLVLENVLKDLDWKSQPPPLSGLSDDNLEVILHFAYAQCLPPDISIDSLNNAVESTSDVKGLEGLIKIADEFKEKSALCQKIHDLLNELHGIGNAIIMEFGGHPVTTDRETEHSGFGHPELLVQNPARLAGTLRLCLKYFVVAFIKLVHLSNLFVANKSKLSRSEQNEIIAFAKYSLPIFLTQAYRCVSALKNCTNSVNLRIRQELGTHFVPELESFTDMLSYIGYGIKDLLEAVILAESDKLYSSTENSTPEASHSDVWNQEYFDILHPDYQKINLGSLGCKIGSAKSLEESLQVKDLYNLKILHRHFTKILAFMGQERESFAKQMPAGKVRALSWYIDQMIDELPLFILRLEAFSNLLDERLDFGTFKFCFLVGTSIAENILSKFKEQKQVLQPLLEQICSMVQNDSLNASLSDLGLVDFPEDFDNASAVGNEHIGLYTMSKTLDFGKNLCIPPSINDNLLVDCLSVLFETKVGADMTICIVVTAESTSPNECSSNHVISCHRAVLAARCPFFRRALTSGMKEAIERKVEVYDTNLSLFTCFLKFVYTGKLDLPDSSIDTISEILLLGDLYELESLKDCCQLHLLDLIDSETVLSLISIADRFNATKLKDGCVDYIMKKREVVQSSTFSELDAALQYELSDLVSWEKNAMRKAMSPVPEGFSRLINLTSTMKIDSPDDLETTPLTQDSSRLETCVMHLRDVLGPLIDEEQLIQVALAADYDVNRALNYFFNSEQEET